MGEPFLSTYGTLVVGGLTLLSVMALVMSLRPAGDVVTDRLSSHARVSDLAVADLDRPFSERAIYPVLRSVLRAAAAVLPRHNIEKQRRALLVAGNPGGLSVADYVGLRMILAGLCLGGVIFLVARQPVLDWQSMAIVVAAPVLGYMAPAYWIRMRTRRRQHEVQRALPDALDMLTVCVESGLGLEAALLRVGEQWDNALTREFGRAVREVRMGITRADALRHMVMRTDVPDLASFVAIVIQAEQLGVSIANVLRTQADQMRVVRWQRAEEKARAAPFKMVFALVFFTFPSLLIVILGPAIPRFQEIFGYMGSR